VLSTIATGQFDIPEVRASWDHGQPKWTLSTWLPDVQDWATWDFQLAPEIEAGQASEQ
jgi:hypothetical protein